MLNREGTIEVNLDKADLFAVFVEIINGLFDGVTYRTHGDDDLFGVSCAVVVKELIFGAELCVDSLHIILNNADSLVIINVGGLSCLEENIGVLCGSALNGMLGVEGAATECVHGVMVEKLVEVLIIPNRNLLNFVRGAETVEEMEEGHSALNGRKVSHGAEIHNLLGVVGT